MELVIKEDLIEVQLIYNRILQILVENSAFEHQRKIIDRYLLLVN